MLSIKSINGAIIEKRGNIAAVARCFDVERSTIYRRINKSKKLSDTLIAARETMLDNAETALYDSAIDGNTTALIFFLKTQGKNRGYTERQEVDHSGKIDNRVTVIDYGLGDDDNAPD